MKAASFGRDGRGSTAILFGLSMPVLIGGLGLGFEASNWYMVQRAMQNAADAAVLAAASNAGANYDVEGKAVAAQSGFTHGVSNVGVAVLRNVACPSGGTTCYSATITNSVPLYLSTVVGYAGNGNGKKDIVATAVAKIGTIQRPYCLLALASSGTRTAVRTNGSPSSDLAGCSIKSNTDADCQGHDLGADYGDAVGTSSDCGKVQNSGVPPTVDPYADLAANIPPNTCGGVYPQIPSTSVSTWSGTKNPSGNVVICGDLKLTGNVIVNAPSNAVLVIVNGQLDTNGFRIQTSSGSGLTIVFTGTIGGSYIHAPTGKGIIDIAAPTSGPWSGVMIYQDPRLTSGVDISAAGSSPTWNITGLVYLPHASVTLNGAVNKSSYGGSCFVLVVDNLLMKGAANLVPRGGCVAAGLTMPTGSSPGRGQLVN
ncbi:MAG: pilus assembly protein TadG-related protein [Gammaproteobacteria bacterium]|nr:pilus assembly protein TadG-related protein [Gammaproteobacteria bacterium]